MNKVGIFSSVRTKFYLGMMVLVIVTQIINGMTLVNTRKQEIASEILFNAMIFAEYNAEEVAEYYGKADGAGQEKLFRLIDEITTKNHDIESIYLIDDQNRIVLSPESYNRGEAITENHDIVSPDLLKRMESGEVSMESILYGSKEMLDILYPMEGEYDGKDYFVRFLFNYHNQEASIAEMQNQMLLNGIGSVFVGMLLIIVISNHFTRPIRQLVAHVKLASTGNFSSAVNISSNDELGTLFKAFNSMQSQLSHSFGELISTRDELSRLNTHLEQRVEERTRELNEKNEQLAHLSVTDKLTGCYNRLKLDSELEKEHERFAEKGEEFAVIMIDLDYFKQVNDNFGHTVGDSVLREASQILQNTVRESDIVGRWGGEEFVIICPGTSKESAVSLAERVRGAIADYHFEHVGHRSASFGVSVASAGDTFETLNSRADSALYKAKEDGRNRVVFA